MKNLESLSVAILLVGMMFILGSVMKEVAESGPVVHKAISQFVGTDSTAGVN